jgi:general stress protein YciG
MSVEPPTHTPRASPVEPAASPPTTRPLRGFAAMDPERRREIARKGGLSVPARKRSFARNPELAAEAGRRGGERVPAEKRSFARSRGLAAAAGRKGGSLARKGAEKRDGKGDGAIERR